MRLTALFVIRSSLWFGSSFLYSISLSNLLAVPPILSPIETLNPAALGMQKNPSRTKTHLHFFTPRTPVDANTKNEIFVLLFHEPPREDVGGMPSTTFGLLQIKAHERLPADGKLGI